MAKCFAALLLFCVGMVSVGLPAHSVAAERKPYSFFFLSNSVAGKEKLFAKWYTGQHVHDLLAIDGFEAAKFFTLADTQFVGTHLQRYTMIWETDNLPAVFERVPAA